MYFRSRLAGFRQFSAASFATIRQRISESGRRMLATTSASGQVEVAVEAKEGELSDDQGIKRGIESLSEKVGDTRISIQTSKFKRIQNTSGSIMAGIFPDGSVLTLFNSELEVLPQSAFRLPKTAEKVLLLENMHGILVAAVSKTETSSKGSQKQSEQNDCIQHHLHLVSSRHAELHVESNELTKRIDPVFQVKKRYYHVN